MNERDACIAIYLVNASQIRSTGVDGESKGFLVHVRY